MKPLMRFDRRVSEWMLRALEEGGVLHPLVNCGQNGPLLDLQLRADPARRRSWVSLYAGLSSVLDVEEHEGEFRLRAHATYRMVARFDDAWSSGLTPDALSRAWPEVEGYLDRVLSDTNRALQPFLRREGQVHPVMSAARSAEYRAIQREATVAFRSQEARVEVMNPVSARFATASGPDVVAEAWGAGNAGPARVKADVIAVDAAGRLAVIEAKPPSETAGIRFAPVQARLAGEVFRRLLEVDESAADILDEMLQQRVRLGLARPFHSLARPVRVVPVVAIGAGPVLPSALDRLGDVERTLAQADGTTTLDALEVWFLSEDGGIKSTWSPGSEDVPSVDRLAVGDPAAGAWGFQGEARRAAARWKERTPSLLGGARAPAPCRGVGPWYSFCLPLPYAVQNLLPEARVTALERFRAAGIPWHQGVGGDPSNHLLSSQVQCANALAPFVHEPEALARLFVPVLPVAEVIPFGAPTGNRFDEQDHVVFEWIGLDDHLGEHPGHDGTRGANTTSADAAIRYRTQEGRVEVALVEWKYTEQYVGHHLSGGAASQLVRRARYERLFRDCEGPLRTDLIPYEDLFVEPFYQLMRLQLLAWSMERAGELDADVVRLVVVAPSANRELSVSFNRPSHRDLGGGFGSAHHAPARSVWQAWRSTQRRPDRFGVLDSARLVAAGAPTSAEFKDRYGHLAEGADDHTMPATAGSVSTERVRSACAMALMVLQRLASSGGVIAQLSEMGDAELGRVDPVVRTEVAARLEELAELARRARAEELYEILHGDDSGPHTGRHDRRPDA